MTKGLTATGIAFEVAGDPAASLAPVVLIHAGIADMRMWDPVWDALITDRVVMRPDLRGFGGSAARPIGPLDHRLDLSATMDTVGIGRAHLVAGSLGAGVAAEMAVAHPDRVASLLLAGPGGSLIGPPTEWLRATWRAEVDALETGDLDAAVEVNLRAWVDGPGRSPDEVDPDLRALVGEMQRRAFELTIDWDDVEEDELDPPVLDRLGDIGAPTLVLQGDGDGDAIVAAADRVVAGVRGARLVRWPTVAHLPSMEWPDAFTDLVRGWLTEVEPA